MAYPPLDNSNPGVDPEMGLALPEENVEFLGEITKDFKRLQRQKNRKKGGVEARILKSKAFRWGEQYVSQQAKGLVSDAMGEGEDNKLYLVFNFIEGAHSKLVGRLTSLGGEFYARPDKKDPKALAEAEVVDKLILALDEKVDQPTRMWELVDNLLTDGVVFEYVPWIPDKALEPVPQFDDNNELLFIMEDQPDQPIPESQRDQMIQSGIPQEKFVVYEELDKVGDVGSEILSALNVFIDQSVQSVEDLAPDQAVYIAKIKTHGWIEENYGPVDEGTLDGKLQIVTTSVFQDGDTSASLFLKDLIPTLQGEQGEDDPKCAVVVERYQPSSKKHPRGRFTCFIPDVKILFDGENPYEEIPLVDIHFKPVTTTFWTKDFITDLIAPQKFINKRLSQLGEQANATIYDKILLPATLSAKDVDPDSPGVIQGAMTETGQPLVGRLAGPQLPTWFLESINVVTKMFQQIAGGSDLFDESSFPGQMRGPMAVPLLQELLDSQWGALYQHLGSRLARIKQMRVNRVKKFYPPIRTLHYVDKTERDEVMVFHTEKILRAGTNYQVTVERGSLIPEFKALREQRIMARLNSPLSVLYLDERTGTLDKSKVALDLHEGDYGREGKESQSRKFARQLIDRLWKAEEVPPVMQFWDHEPMIDELESVMMTTEWLSASPQVQQLFTNQWNQHSQALQQRAAMQQQGMMNQAIQTSVAQATQQAAAMAAAQTVDSALTQVQAQKTANKENPVGPQIAQARGQFPQGG